MKKLFNILKNKYVVIVSLIVLSLALLVLITCFIFLSALKLNGDSKISISYNETYQEQGATLKLLGNDLSKNIKIKSNVKNGKVGRYKVEYKIKLLIITLKKERIVNIVDKDAPIIDLKGEKSVTICPGKEYEEEGYTAIDLYDGDLTDKVKRKVIDTGISYEVSDSSDNKEKVLREIIKEDKEAPNIKLKGSKTVYIRTNNKYNEPGYEATDNCETNIEVKVNSNVDTSKDGKYTITYEATDTAGNKTTEQRNIVVYTDNRIGVVYLTFDDGPSGTGSTAKILDVLKAEDVKATFFVTGSGPDSLIKREYDEGHTVALHTNTHKYNVVYSSVDNYYNDLNAVSNRVYNITGVRSKIIRFPGGSNNTVSNNYYKGIMDILVKDVVDKGYTYFDWNVSSGDAGSCTTSSCVYNSVVNNLSKNRVNVVLMHDIKWFTADAIQDIITYGKSNGYIFKPIDESTYPVRFK